MKEKDVKSRLIKEYMEKFQSNEERLEYLRWLIERKERGDEQREDKNVQEPLNLELPSPEEIHERFLNGLKKSIEIPSVDEKAAGFKKREG
ncbi:MAG TPA: hypothetical protein EYP29_05660 [Thermoplasmata archaeon]|nr:hypothetical protein [Thermoplasmata archaeon]